MIILSSPSSIRALVDKGSASVERPSIRLVEITLEGMNVALTGDGKLSIGETQEILLINIHYRSNLA